MRVSDRLLVLEFHQGEKERERHAPVFAGFDTAHPAGASGEMMKGKDMPRIQMIKILLLVVVAVAMIDGGLELYKHRHFQLPLVAGPGVTKVKKLSEYCEGIAGTMADTSVFFLEGREPGGKILILANTHSNEPAALLATLIFMENAVVEKGTLILIPQFNHSGSRNTRPGDGYPLYFEIPTDWGSKKFRMGNRDASWLDQWPDPDVYVHYPDRQLLSFIDTRNTNRTWPGRPDGPLMERVTYAAMQIIRNEKVDVVVDVHGAETMFPVTNCIVAPEKSMRIATMTTLTVKAQEKFDNHVEPSPSGFRGLSHREIGDHSDAMPFLLEAPIPFLDQPTGPKTVDLLLDGKDPFLLSLSKKGKLFVPYDETGWPIAKRVGQHCSVIQELMRQYTRKFPEKGMAIRNVPKYADVVANGVGFYFHDPKKTDKKSIYFN
jgi:predicted nucleic acid-binding Zn ribbon protein